MELNFGFIVSEIVWANGWWNVSSRMCETKSILSIRGFMLPTCQCKIYQYCPVMLVSSLSLAALIGATIEYNCYVEISICVSGVWLLCYAVV
jgi:hypothetical protein